MTKEYRNIDPSTNMPGFINSLRKEDERNRKMTRNLQWIMWVLAPVYLLLFALPQNNTLYEKAGGLAYAVSFTLFGFIMKWLNKEYRMVDYGLPTVQMLSQVARRYKLFQRKILLVIPPMLILELAMILILYKPEIPGHLLRITLITQALILPSAGIGFFIGCMIWRKRQKPLRDAALKMLNDLQH